MRVPAARFTHAHAPCIVVAIAAAAVTSVLSRFDGGLQPALGTATQHEWLKRFSRFQCFYFKTLLRNRDSDKWVDRIKQCMRNKLISIDHIRWPKCTIHLYKQHIACHMLINRARPRRSESNYDRRKARSKDRPVLGTH